MNKKKDNQIDLFNQKPIESDWRDHVDYDPLTGRVSSVIYDVCIGEAGSYLRLTVGEEREYLQVFAAKKMGAYFPGCDVHHVNENKHDNRWKNLQCMTHKEHMQIHSYIQGHEKDAIMRRWPLKRSCPYWYFVASDAEREIHHIQYTEKEHQAVADWYYNVATREAREPPQLLLLID